MEAEQRATELSISLYSTALEISSPKRLSPASSFAAPRRMRGSERMYLFQT